MNKQKNNNAQQGMSQSATSMNSATSGTNATNGTNAKGKSVNAKQQASKAEYGTLTAKEDANNDYE